MFDLLGYPLAIGDTVIYAVGCQSDTGLYVGTIDSFAPATYGRNQTALKIRTKADRLLTNTRHPQTVINTKYLTPLTTIQESYPELFI